MTKITEQAMDAYTQALKGRTIKRYDVCEKVTAISEVKYNDNGQAISTKRVGTIDHAT